MMLPHVMVIPYVFLPLLLLYLSWVLLIQPYNFYCKVKAIAKAHPELKIATPPSFVPLFGDVFRLRKVTLDDNPHGLFEENVAKGGRINVVFFGVRPYLFLNDADLIKTALETKPGKEFPHEHITKLLYQLSIPNSLIIQEGERWKRQRQLLLPAFSHRMMKEYVIAMQRVTQKELDSYMHDSSEIDFKKLFVRLGLKAICICGCGESDTGNFLRLSNIACEVSSRMAQYRFTPLLLIPGTTWIPTKARSLLVAKGNEGKAIALDIIQNRIDGRSKPGINVDHDFLDSLLSFRYEDTGEGLPLEQICDDLLLFLTAGHETTAFLLSWMMVIFAQYPDVEAKCRSEVLSVMNGGLIPSEADVKKMHYLHATIMETLRVYPPGPWIGRTSLRPYDLGGGQIVAAGTNVMIHVWGVHHNPTYWPDPFKFDPERFLVMNEETGVKQSQLPKGSHPCAWIPFSYIPRSCPGRQFALLEARLVMSAMLVRFNFAFSPGQKFVGVKKMLLGPKYPILGRLIPRV